ncbi:MAG: transglycosylase domain-containing protein [Clostridiales bacterium]|nr:transglycosylase domain-containing protein [Clostridiales bacterium]
MKLFLRNKSKAATVIKLVFGSLLLFVSAALIAASVVFRFDEWHELDTSLIIDCPQALTVLDSEGNVLSMLGGEKRIWIGTDKLQKHTLNAFVSAEDARFYTHTGVDLYRIFGAAWADLKAGDYVQGASTISQQLIKLSHLSREKTLDRKLEEAVLATELEKHYSKDEIMEMYLNYVYFGGGFYGIEAASMGYFGIHACELSAAQSALLAGILKSPSAYAPHLDFSASNGRKLTVLRLMHDYGYLTDDEYAAACKEEITIKNGLPREMNDLIAYAIKEASAVTGLSREELYSGGYSVYTTLDPAVNGNCAGMFSDGGMFPSDNAQAAIVVIGRDGGILSMIGGRGEYSEGGLNRAADAERQPGSLIKPILVYAPALQLYGYSAATVLDDEPKDFGGYSPRNSDDKYYGKVTLRTAVTKSLNVPAVEVLDIIGVESAVGFAERLGVSFDREEEGLSLALGGFTYGVSPLEMAGAYSAFSRGGLYIKPFSVMRITDREGRTVFERQPTYERIMSEENAFILSSLLRSVVTDGTGRRLLEAGVPLAAKTGTSIDENGVRDAWCAAYTDELTAVVWMGTDSAKLGSLPEGSVGGSYPAVMLARLFKDYYADRAYPEPEAPDGIRMIRIDVSEESGGKIYLAGEYTPDEQTVDEYFSEGTEPLGVNPYWSKPSAPDDVGWSIAEGGFPVISFTSKSEAFIYVIRRTDSLGNETEVERISGRSGYVSFTDRDVIPGGMYSYRVTAEHPELKNEDGSPLEGEPSRTMRVIVPFYY